VVAVVWILTLAVAAGVARRPDFLLLIACTGAGFAAIQHGRRVAAALLLLTGLCAVVGWHASTGFVRDRDAVSRIAGSAGAALVTLDGVVASFPQTGLHGTRFDFATRLGGRHVCVQMRAERFDIGYGERYRMRARFLKPGESGHAFLSSRGLAGSMRARSADIVLLGRAGNPVLRECFWPLHRFFRTRLSRAMGREAGLAIGMLLGERAHLDEPVRDAVRRLGIMHLLAISGMHLTTLAGCVMLFMRRRPRWRSMVLLFSLTVYTVTVGDVESLTRSYLMALLLIAMHATIRPVRAIDALGVTWFVMTVADPLSLRSVGLQLSFAATFAVLVCMPLMKPGPVHSGRRLARFTAGALRPLRAAFLMSLAVEVFIAPLQLHHFGAFSVVGPAATVAFFVPVTLILVGAAPMVALADLLPAAEWPGHALGAFSALTTGMMEACGRASPALFAVKSPCAWLYYGGLLVAWRFRRRRVAWAAAAAMVALSFR
jgi:ComEC/Rec2-related protein